MDWGWLTIDVETVTITYTKNVQRLNTINIMISIEGWKQLILHIKQKCTGSWYASPVQGGGFAIDEIGMDISCMKKL